MRQQTLIEWATELIAVALRFDGPVDAAVARFFRAHPKIGKHEREELSDALYALLRRKRWFEHMAGTGSGPQPRRLALLALAGSRGFLEPALTDAEKKWLAACDAAPVEPLPAACSHNLPDWLAAALQSQLGAESFDALAAALLTPAPLDLRVNALRCKREQALRALAAEGVEAAVTPYSPWGLRVEGKPNLRHLSAFVRGEIEVQDEGSQLIALLLGARRGELVADFCAGAGGKTLALGAAMRSTGRLYAFDVSADRLKVLMQRVSRSGLTNVYATAIAPGPDERLERLAGKLDRVLVDAPCSGLGTLRRNPDLKWRQTPATIGEFAERQRAILQRVARLVKTGGTLVYATCSLLEAEDEAVARVFTAENESFQPLEVARLLGASRIPAAESLCSDGGKFLRLWPHRHGTDGFFAAAWQRGN